MGQTVVRKKALLIFGEVNNLSPLTPEETRKITIFSTPGTGTGQTRTIVHVYILYSTMAGFICCILHYTGQEGEKGGEIERQKEREDGVTSSSVIGIQK